MKNPFSTIFVCKNLQEDPMFLIPYLTPKKTVLGIIAALLFLLSFQVIAAKKTVALLPLHLYADPSKAHLGQGIKAMLASRLSGEGLDVISSDSVLSEADKQGVTSEQRAEELARLLKANYAVFGSITSVGAGYSLDLSFMDLTKDKPIVTKVSEGVTEDQLIPKLSDIVYDFRAIAAGVDIRKQVSPGAAGEEEKKGLFFKPTADSYGFRPTGRASVQAGVMSLDVGDFDGDGQNEIVVVSRDALMVYARKEKFLVLKDTLRAAMGEQFLKVNVADADGNGRAEIYLVSFYGSRAQSSILEWTGKFTRKVDRQNGHLSVLRNQSGGTSSVLFQNSAIPNFFDGPIWQMTYDHAGKLVCKEVLPGLKNAQIYTLTLYDFNRDGKLEFLGLGQPNLEHSSPLLVWDQQGNPLTVVDEKLGGTNNYIRSGFTRPDDQPPANLVNSRIVAMDVDDDGKKEILVVANNTLAGELDFVAYYDGSVVVFKPEGATLVQAYKSGKIRFCLTDMQVQGKTLYLAGEEGQISNMSEGAGRIMWYE
jgi:TolB-like protein